MELSGTEVNNIYFSFLYTQAELFDKFLLGSTLEECYSAVAAVADRWLDLLDVCQISGLISYLAGRISYRRC